LGVGTIGIANIIDVKVLKWVQNIAKPVIFEDVEPQMA
jgi:hypothetical protein